MYITITVKDSNFVKTAWDILKQDGKIHMELTPSFFAVLHGSLQDKFGINWMFTVSK
jgi:PhnB protein